jgi:uncharacterized protein (DUF433 family)
MDYSGIITLEPEKRGGKPCVRGLRITVYEVLEQLASGMTHEEIASLSVYDRARYTRLPGVCR